MSTEAITTPAEAPVPGVTTETVEQPCVVCGDVRTYQADIVLVGGRRIVKRKPEVVCSESCQQEYAQRVEQQHDAAAAYQLAHVKAKTWRRFAAADPSLLVPQLKELPVESCILLAGPTGTGKTFQAWAWWQRWALATGVYGFQPARFYNEADLMELIRRTYDGEPFGLPASELVVIDDVGTARATEWVAEQFHRIIDQRYRDCLPLVVTTNLVGKEFRDRVGDRLASRLVEMCEVVKLGGGDLRLNGKQFDSPTKSKGTAARTYRGSSHE